jgi:oligoendopeptidase F
MSRLLLIPAVLAALAGAGAPQYRIDPAHYFPSTGAEAQSRHVLQMQSTAFIAAPVPNSPQSLLAWLERYDTLLVSSNRHEIYVYLRAEEDDRDALDASADSALEALEDRLDGRLMDVARALGQQRIATWTKATALAPYRFLLSSSLSRAHHRLDAEAAHVVATAVDPVIDAAGSTYKALRKSSDDLASRQETYAALLITIATARSGVAHLQGFADAPAASYFDKSIDPQSVRRMLAAVRASGAYGRYTKVASLAPKSLPTPAPLSVKQAIALILSAEAPMGNEYAGAYRALLDPAERRLEVCTDLHCDDAGFSVGLLGSVSGVFYGGFQGTTNQVRALAHESGHAVHRQFMNLHQPIAAYNEGPHFVFESFAIFNELLFLDHLYETASSRNERAFYLNRFLDDATFQVFGSAQETDLEASIYRGIADGSIRTAGDFNALAVAVFSRYDPSAAHDPSVPPYWARDRLYYIDPLYDINYLYAGLLALRYFSDFQRDPATFSKRYVALLKNGFDASPAALERRFLGIELTDERALVDTAGTLIDVRTAELQRLYTSADGVR